jgi:disulfide bond formation protein DsbB
MLHNYKNKQISKNRGKYMKIQKPIIILFSALLIALLVGCGGGDSPSENSAETTANNVVAPTEEVHAGDAVAGETLYQQSCVACHGADAKGVTNLGKDLTTSEFVQNSSDAELLAFVKVGRPVSDAANTTGIDMPPKGGNPALQDEQLMNIIAYIRTLEE